MRRWFWTYSLLIAALMTGCKDPIVRDTLVCDGELVEDGRLAGISNSQHFPNKQFGDASLQAKGKGRNKSNGILTREGGPIVHFVLDSLVAGEHFVIQAWQHRSTQSGMIHALWPNPQKPVYEWQQRKTTQRHEGDWTLMLLDITITERMEGKPLHVIMKPGGKDSTVLFDDIKIDWVSRRPTVTYHRRGIMHDKAGKTYQTVLVGGNWWMAEDLKTGSKSGTYNYEEAQKVVPEGWHIPTDEDWFGVEEQLGIYPTSLRGKGGRGSNLSYRILEGGDSGLDFEPTTEDKAHPYWTSSPASDSTHWTRFIPRHTGIGRAEVENHRKLKLRCVMDRNPQP